MSILMLVNLGMYRMSYGSDHDPYDMWCASTISVAQTQSTVGTMTLYMVHHHDNNSMHGCSASHSVSLLVWWMYHRDAVI